MSNWISVKDRLPPFDQVVMVCYPSGYDGAPLYAWGARMDDGDGWLWGVRTGYGSDIRYGEDASQAGIEVDDDYPVQFWKELDAPPTLQSSPQGSA